MARSLKSEPPPPGWVSDAEFRAELERYGARASYDQLRRWRLAEFGLLSQTFQDAASSVWHAPESARQVVAIERLLGEKKRTAAAGKILWAAGFDVAPRHWAPALENADRSMKLGAPIIRTVLRWVENQDRGETFGEAAAAIGGLTGSFAKMRRRLDQDEAARAINVATEIAIGEFEHFDIPATDRDAVITEDVFLNAFDFDKGKEDQILGFQLSLGKALQGVLAAISQTQDGPGLPDFSPVEIDEARNDVRNTLKIIVCLYDGLSWIYGDTAFGLRFAAYFAQAVAVNVIFSCTLGVARLRRHQIDLYSSGQIAKMADQAERAWLMSCYFRDLYYSRPELEYLIGPKRMKLGFSSRFEHQKMLEELAGYEFPEPQFRPWGTWQKLAKRTISPGLLAISIGSQLTAEIADIMPNASDSVIP